MFVCTSQETHYISATKPNQLIVFTEGVPVYCGNLGTHNDYWFLKGSAFRVATSESKVRKEKM
jgi:hypothetical protein